MAGAFHFLAMTTLTVATAVAIVRGFGRPTWGRAGAAAAAGFGSLFVGLLFLHGCDTGAPLTQWAVGAGCALASILFVGDRRARLGLALGSLLVMAGLAWHYTAIVHGADWVGNPASFTLDGPATAEWHTWLTRLWAR